ncbi:MAG: Abi family protein, partial [Muribaculaceae bacterium]|nr:Abi family protein [Muribaculaceae bacterium]
GGRHTWLNSELTEIQKKKPYAVMCAIAYLCKAVNPKHGFVNAVKYLCSKYSDIQLRKYGFPIR